MSKDTNFKDYYEILNVRPSSTLYEIKIAYRALIRQYHPDISSDPAAEVITKSLNEAYSILSNPKSRSSYDEIFRQKQQEKQNFEKLEILINIDLKTAYYGGNYRIKTKTLEFDLEIPSGIESGEILFSRLGNTDIFVTVDIEAHKYIYRENQDIYLDHPVSLYTAVLGGRILVKFFDEELVVNVPAGTSADQPLRIRNKGFPSFGDRQNHGHLYIRLLIRVPTDLTLQEKRLFEQLLDLSENKKKHE